jgi:hypothetical protein
LYIAIVVNEGDIYKRYRGIKCLLCVYELKIWPSDS